MDCTLVVLAAGMGNRFGGLKQLTGVGPNGETLLEYGVYDACRAGVKKVVFVIRESFAAEFHDKVISRFAYKLECVSVFQDLNDIPAPFVVPEDREKPWGTGHALLAARNEINGPFMVINGDDFYGAEAYKQLFTFLDQGEADEKGFRYGLVGYALKRTLSDHGTVSRGICEVDVEGYLESLTEHTKLAWNPSGTAVDSQEAEVDFPGEKLVSLNLFGLQAGLLPYLASEFNQFLQQNSQNPKSEFFLPEIVSRHVHANQATLQVIPTEETWFGMTYQEDRQAVEKAIQEKTTQGIYPPKLWE
jgi:NDP-sugar pyrophosphorylase family protein